MRALTRPTRGRIALWTILAVAWLALLPQDLAMDSGHHRFSWAGAVVWGVVLLVLLACLTQTWRNYRAR